MDFHIYSDGREVSIYPQHFKFGLPKKLKGIIFPQLLKEFPDLRKVMVFCYQGMERKDYYF